MLVVPPEPDASTHLSRIIDVLAVVGPALAFMWRWLRRIEQSFVVVKDHNNNHFPFIYGRLRIHDEALSLPSPEHPNLPLINGTRSKTGTADA